MTEVLLFHHAQGLTPGCRSLADRLSTAGHVVHTPDLYDGQTFSEFAAGIAHAEQIGFAEILERGRSAAERLPAEIVYAGISLGVLPAQMLAQTRPGACGAMLVSAAIPPSEFGDGWPGDLPVQIHMMEHDPVVTEEGDLAAARLLTETTDRAQLYLYPGNRHLFVDDGLPDHDSAAARSTLERMLAFLASLANGGIPRPQ